MRAAAKTCWVATAVIGALACCVGCANKMFYHPVAQLQDDPRRHGLDYESVSFPSADGTMLSGWFMSARGKAKGTVVHFHGNAVNMGNHYPYVAWLTGEGFNVLLFDYRGYGLSEGKPEREGIYQDCVAALHYAAARKDVDPDRIVLLGQSLGGANAIAVMPAMGEAKVRAVAIDSTFYSYRSIVRDKMKAMPVVSLLRWPLSFLVVSNRRSPGAVVDEITPVPLLVIHGTDDRVIPFHHGQKLFEAAGEPKEFIVIKGGDHTDALVREEATYRRRLVDFFVKALAGE